MIKNFGTWPSDIPKDGIDQIIKSLLNCLGVRNKQNQLDWHVEIEHCQAITRKSLNNFKYIKKRKKYICPM